MCLVYILTASYLRYLPRHRWLLVVGQLPTSLLAITVVLSVVTSVWVSLFCNLLPIKCQTTLGRVCDSSFRDFDDLTSISKGGAKRETFYFHSRIGFVGYYNSVLLDSYH